MKKKIMITLTSLLILASFLLCGFFILQSKHKDPNAFFEKYKNLQNGIGDEQTIKSALSDVAAYPKLKNDTDFIWHMMLPILQDRASRENAIVLLNDYLLQTQGLKIETILTIKGNIAMLYMSNEEYGDSIYIFNEIISKADKIGNSDIRARLKIKSYEYLGNMYAELSDETAAIQQYDRAINEFVGDDTVNAACKYGSYINKVESYIQLKDYDKAQQASMKIDEIIPFLSPEIASGVEIFNNKNLVIIKSHQQDFEKANQHLQKCYELLKNDNDVAFLNTEMYVRFAYCEMLMEKNENLLAIQELNKLLDENLNQGFGFDSYCYELLAKLYKKTGQTDKYLEVSAKIYESDEKFNSTLKQDYLTYVEESFALDQLREKEKLYKNGIMLLLIFILLCITAVLITIICLKKASQNSMTDSLTEVYNRKYLAAIMKKKSKIPADMVVMMADIDYFKIYNDTYGHPAGDKAIRAVADILKESIRGKDKLIRYGGEEFLLLFENLDSDGIDTVCSRIARKTNERHILHENSKTANYLTLSLGVAAKQISCDADLKLAISEADEALYSAKQNGRNQYVVYENNGEA